MAVDPKSKTFDDRVFEFLRASDIKRDGMGFEAYEDGYEKGELVAEVFYFDAYRRAVFSAFKTELPVELVEYMLTHGLTRIRPVEK